MIPIERKAAHLAIIASIALGGIVGCVEKPAYPSNVMPPTPTHAPCRITFLYTGGNSRLQISCNSPVDESEYASLINTIRQKCGILEEDKHYARSRLIGDLVTKRNDCASLLSAY